MQIKFKNIVSVDVGSCRLSIFGHPELPLFLLRLVWWVSYEKPESDGVSVWWVDFAVYIRKTICFVILHMQKHILVQNI